MKRFRWREVDGESRYGCREIHRESWRELDGERWMKIT
jgi:hypothetical protein